MSNINTLGWITKFAKPKKRPKPKMVTRKIYVCASCEGVYADEPVTQCDCMPAKTKFIKTSITYREP